MLARSRELIRCRGATALGTSGSTSSSTHQLISGSLSTAGADAHSRISGHESARAGTTRNSSSTSIAPRLATVRATASAATGGLSVSASAADLAFVSSLAAHLHEQHEQQQRKLRQQAPIYQQLHQSHRRSPFAHNAKSRSSTTVASAAASLPAAEFHSRQPPQTSLPTAAKPRVAQALHVRVKKSSSAGSSSSKKHAALRQNAPGATECELPMDMECGCKTKRLKEQQEAEALAAAARLASVVSSNQHDDLTVQTTPATVTPSAAAVVVTNSSPVPAHHHAHVSPTSSSVAYESSFHRRHLPQDCIAFSSPEGRKLFTQAINSASNYMQIYFPLAEQFITQAEPAFCGLATLAMCLNALQIDPGRLWKGPWRWFSEELFDCCTSLSVAKEKGISLSEFICLARCNGVLTDDVRADESLSLDAFRAIVKRSCATSNEIVVLNYSRKVLGQTGDGHFSPIGGYHEENDMVLLLDVARFKYPPHWVRLPLVFEAMQKIDESIGRPRGLVVLKENAHATGPTLVKQLVHSATPELPLKPAPKVCCDSAVSLESARHVLAFANQS